MEQGDFVLVKTHHFVSKLIRFGQRGYGKDAEWNHVAFYIGGGRIVEALTSGVVISRRDKYSAEDSHDVRLDVPNTSAALVMRLNAVSFAISCVGESYGWTTILAIALKTIFKGRWNFGVQGTSICSGLVARSMERMGYNFNPDDPAELTPAYLAKKFG